MQKLANKKFVVNFVKNITDMQTANYNCYRRIWADKATDATKRNLAFRFFNAEEAKRVAEELEWYLFCMGYNNKVKLTSTHTKSDSYMHRRIDSDYVRVQVLAN